MILPNIYLILGMVMMLNVASSSQSITIPLFNYRIDKLSRVGIKNAYLKWALSYETQKKKQRANIVMRYVFRNINIKKRDTEVLQTIVTSKAINSFYDLSFKYYNLSREEAELIELIISSIN